MKKKLAILSEDDIMSFGATHDLTMRVRERAELPKFSASFRGVDVQIDGRSLEEHGNGETPEEAIADYAKKISFKTIIVDAHYDSRKEISCPRLTLKEK